MTKMQKRQMQRLEADARNSGVMARWLRPNPRWERPLHRLPVAPKHHDDEAGRSTMPP